jgi:hypothetical protein
MKCVKISEKQGIISVNESNVKGNVKQAALNLVLIILILNAKVPG